MNLEFTNFLQHIDTTLFDDEIQKNKTFYFAALKIKNTLQHQILLIY